MNKQAILSLLVAGLVTGSYIEFQVNQSDDVVAVIEAGAPELPFEAVEPSPPVVEELIPPPAPEERGIPEAPTFTPFSVAPSILNRNDVVQAMEREYPPELRDAGIGGTVRVYFYIDEEGRVQDRQIDASSGHRALDDAAMAVSEIYRFSPALNRDEKVPVWVSFPITFQVR